MWLHFDCFSGISGDMTLGALCDLGLPLEYLQQELQKLQVDGYTLSLEQKSVQGFDAVKCHVDLSASSSDAEHHNHSHAHGHSHSHDPDHKNSVE